MGLKKFIATTIRECLNENSDIINDYSGEYYDLYNFILDNDLQHFFVDKYSEIHTNLTIVNWEDFVRGEMGSDEEIIKELIGNNYKIYYDDDKDSFLITKKKSGKTNYRITFSNDYEINRVIEETGVYSEYEPRLAVILNNKIIGGSTYEIDEDGVYNFDIGILDEYQGYGISTKLISAIISDAKKMKSNGIKAQVVNNILFDYLIKNEFSGTNDSGVKYVYKQFKKP